MQRPGPTEEDEHQADESSDGSESLEDLPRTDPEDNETSSSGSSSESESEDEEDGEVDAIFGTSRPSRLPQPATSPTALKSRLAAFIPQIQQANADLETDPDAAKKRVDDVADDEEQYIEMNLGLGVLKGKHAAGEQEGVKTNVSESSDSSSDDSTSAAEDGAGAENTEVGIIDKLQGVKASKRKIEEVN